MGTYTPDEMLMPTGLDSLGLKYSMERLPKEPLWDYRRRLLLEARDPSDPSEESVVRNINRKVGEFEIPQGVIDLVLDSNGDPVAADPYIEITSNWLRAYHDYSAGESGLEFEVDLFDRKWFFEVRIQFLGSTYFTFTQADTYTAYIESKKTRIGNTAGWRNGRVLQQSYMNALQDNYIDQILFTDLIVFQEEKSTRAAVTEPGDYYVDYSQGVVISNDVQQGNVYYSYRKFPYTVYSQPVNITFLNDADIDYRLKDKLISDESGELEPAALSPHGAELLNKVLAAHPLGWGK